MPGGWQKNLACRIDGAPVFSEYINSFVAEKPSDAIFFNRETPGYFYTTIILKVMKSITK